MKQFILATAWIAAVLMMLGSTSRHTRAAEIPVLPSKNIAARPSKIGTIDDDGKLRKFPNPVYRGDTFTINRRTGRFSGQMFPNGWQGTGSVVIGHGSDKDGFDAIYYTLLTPHNHVLKLYIRHHAKTKDKPFVISLGGTIINGTCTLMGWVELSGAARSASVGSRIPQSPAIHGFPRNELLLDILQVGIVQPLPWRQP